MFWVVLIIAVAIISVILDTRVGKITVSTGVVGVSLLLLSWITGLDIFVVLAKGCAIAIIVVVTGIIIVSIVNK